MRAPGLFSRSREMTWSIYKTFKKPNTAQAGGPRYQHSVGQGPTLRRLHRLGWAQHHFVDRPAGGHHREDVLQWSDLHVEQIRSRFPDRSFQRGAEFPWLIDGTSLDAIGGRKLFGIGEAIQLHGAEPVIVEERLPLAHHAEIAVVHDDDLDRQTVAGDGCELGNRHLESAIPAD